MSRKTLNSGTKEAATNILEELTSHRVGVLATQSGDRGISQAVVYYEVDRDFNISFMTKAETNKHSNIQKNSAVNFIVFDVDTQLTIQLTGIANEVIDDELKQQIIQSTYTAAHADHGAKPPIAKLHAGEFVAYQILPQKITMGYFIRPQDGGYDMFETLEFDNEV